MEATKIYQILLIFVIYLFILLILSAIYTEIEPISFGDSFYFWTAISTTIGSTEHQPKSNGGKIYVAIFSILTVIYFLGGFFVGFGLLE